MVFRHALRRKICPVLLFAVLCHMQNERFQIARRKSCWKMPYLICTLGPPNMRTKSKQEELSAYQGFNRASEGVPKM